MRTTSDNSEFDFNLAAVRTLLETQFPGFAAQAVEYLHEGWDNSAFLVNGDWIFRFPKRRERQPWLESEIKALRWVSGQALPVARRPLVRLAPRFVRRGSRSGPT